ncbi:MAG TPA: MG2 domain-containing protein, partial [Gammaproteobacteria bacterium]|nr:MG2 domain-containing protein [Gammaproteobacteria bacterium]
ADAEKIALQGAAGDPIRPQLPQDATDEALDILRFTGPFSPETEYTLQLPDGLLDDAGRPLANQASFPLRVRTDAAPPLVKFPAEFGLIEWNDEAALPVTVRNLESYVPLPELREADAESNAAIKDPGEPSWYRSWYESVRDYYFSPPSAAITGRTLRIEDTQEALRWLRRLKLSRERAGHFDRSRNEYVIDRHAGEKSLFTADDDLDTFQIEKLGDVTAFEVIGIPFEDPGFYVVEIASPRLGAALYGKEAPYHAQTAVLVTNLSAHFKRGRESSLVWVTALDTGRPVAGAEVQVQDCGGNTYAEGETDESGRFAFTHALPDDSDLPECQRWDRALVVTVRDGDDMSFTLSSWDEGISRWRFGLPSAEWTTPYLIRTVFDRTLLRAGETVAMKHFARRHIGAGFDLMETPKPGVEATIQHLGTDQKFTLPLTWDEKGISESVWTIPADARQGDYQVRIAVTGTDMDITSGTFRVEAFRVPMMQAKVQPLAQDAVRPASAEFDIQLNYLSGGGAGNAPVKLRGMINPRSVSFPDYADFTFGNGTVAEGSQTRDPYRLGERGYIWRNPGDEESPRSVILETRELVLDPAGGARATLTGLPIEDTPRDLTAELEYRDANGETLTSAAHVTLWPARLVVGLKPDAWAISKDNLKFQALAVDLQGKPAAGASIKVDLLQRRIYSHRKRLVGGFYAYEHSSEVRRVGNLCEGQTDDHGLLICAAPAPAEGNLILRAQVIDAEGNQSFAHREVWVAGSGAWWFEVGNEDRMDVLPERKHYEPGETATFQVRMPFRQATALVTVEREGVLESFVTELSGDAPVVSVPIQGNHAPNIFVSVLAVRGRAADTQPTALVDLGKPAYKLGIAEIQVGRKAHELDVQVTADKQVYQVRETARVDIDVRRADGGELPAASEVALAAVDTGLLELKSNDSWRLLDAMLERRGIEVETSTAQMQVIGKRHYGKKAVAQGGGGGHVSARELFDTLLLWRGRVALDRNGHAQVDIPLNDSLTEFRIVAVASAGTSLFGTGDTTIRSTQDLMLLSGLPPLAREGDRLLATFTVRNATSAAMDNAVISATPTAEGGATNIPPLEPRVVSLAPGEA